MGRLESYPASTLVRLTEIAGMDDPSRYGGETSDGDYGWGALYVSPQKKASSIAGCLTNFEPIICHETEYAPPRLARKPYFGLPQLN